MLKESKVVVHPECPIEVVEKSDLNGCQLRLLSKQFPEAEKAEQNGQSEQKLISSIVWQKQFLISIFNFLHLQCVCVAQRCIESHRKICVGQ